jgi:hypothetical protein
LNLIVYDTDPDNGIGFYPLTDAADSNYIAGIQTFWGGQQLALEVKNPTDYRFLKSVDLQPNVLDDGRFLPTVSGTRDLWDTDYDSDGSRRRLQAEKPMLVVQVEVPQYPLETPVIMDYNSIVCQSDDFINQKRLLCDPSKHVAVWSEICLETCADAEPVDTDTVCQTETWCTQSACDFGVVACSGFCLDDDEYAALCGRDCIDDYIPGKLCADDKIIACEDDLYFRHEYCAATCNDNKWGYPIALSNCGLNTACMDTSGTQFCESIIAANNGLGCVGFTEQVRTKDCRKSCGECEISAAPSTVPSAFPTTRPTSVYKFNTLQPPPVIGLL